MPHGLFLVADGQHRIFATESGKVTGSTAAVTVGDDCTDFQFGGSLYRLFGQERSHVVAVLVQRNTDIVVRQLVFLRLGGNLGHRLHRFYRILSIGGFTTQHQGIRTIIDGIGNVRYLRTGGTRIGNHGMKHLCGNNHRLLGKNTLADEHTLDARNTFLRNFNTEVTASYHHTVGYFQDFIDIINAFLVLNLSNNTDIAVMSVKNRLDVEYILLIAHKGVGNEVYVLLNSIKDIGAVLLSQRRQIDADAGNVDALAAAQSSLILYFAEQVVGGLLYNNQLQVTVINKDMAVHIQVFDEMGIGYRDTFTGSLLLRVAYHLHAVARLERNGLSQNRRADLRSFRIHQDSDAVGNRTHIVNQLLGTFTAKMCSIHTYNIHTCIEQLLYKINITALVRNRCDNLRLLQ